MGDELANFEAVIEHISSQLCHAVDGDFNFAIKVDSEDKNLQKLGMLINFMLDGMRRNLATVQQQNADLAERSKVLEEINKQLAYEIKERQTAERNLAKLNHEMMEVSRQAGMAEIASGVLHNVGNVLNSLNVSLSTFREKTVSIKVDSLDKLRLKLEEILNKNNVLEKEKEATLSMDYFGKMITYFREFQKESLEEIAQLSNFVRHIEHIISTQQGYAKKRILTEKTNINQILIDAIGLSGVDLEKHAIEIVQEFQELPEVIIDKHGLIQILINLITNAKHALLAKKGAKRTLRLQTCQLDKTKIIIKVKDNGVGISKENLQKIFNQGFTTRSTGHGFGLHMSALTAQEMGGSLEALSDGENQGAEFNLVVPMHYTSDSNKEESN